MFLPLHKFILAPGVRAGLCTVLIIVLLALGANIVGINIIGSAHAQSDTSTEAQSSPLPTSGREPVVPLELPQLPIALPDLTDELRQDLRRLPLELDRLQKAAARLESDSDGLATVRLEAETLQIEAQRLIGQLEPLLPEIQIQLSRLGAAPKDDEPPETDFIRRERRDLTESFSIIDGAIKRTRLTETRVSQLLTRLQEARHNLLARDLLVRSPSPLSPTVWMNVVNRSGSVVSQVYRVLATWLERIGTHAIAFSGVLLLAGLVYLVAIHVRDPFVAAQIRSTAQTEPPVGFLKRSKLATLLAPAFAFPRVAAAAVVAAGFSALALFNRQIDPILIAAFWAFLIYVAVASLSRALLLPGQPTLRLVGVDERGAMRIGALVRTLAAVSAIDVVLFAAISALFLPEDFAVVVGSVGALLFAGLLIAIVRTEIHEPDATAGGRLLSRAFHFARPPVYLTAVAIVLSAAVGYLTLARFIAAQVLVLGCGFVVLFLFHRGVAALFDGDTGGQLAQTSQTSGIGDPVRAASSGESAGADDDDRPTRMVDIVRYILNAVMIGLGAIALLVSWGFSSSDIMSWMRTAIVGFDVGGIRISPARIVGAILLFAGLVVLTRLLQRWLSGNVLDSRRMDPGLANSIHTGIGYAGMAVALLAGVSYAGLDVTNLAIVAGALSVGIGFGLQSIVNNFVSGLILLIERPIKVGDWIVVGEHQGYVRRISVRSTEIETFDRASLILPNSELITGTVQNWTHRNSMGRVVVPVGVSYNCDPDRVLQVLKDAVASCDGLLKFPQPFISFDNFGDSSLDFTVRAYIRDVNNSLSAKTEIRTAITKAFQRENIEIPFPQQDIHLRDLDGLRAMAAKVAERRSSENPEEAPFQDLGDIPKDIRDLMKGS